MKPNNSQLTLIDELISIMGTWKNTNDINSATHVGDISEFLSLNSQYDYIPTESLEEIENSLCKIWAVINKLEND